MRKSMGEGDLNNSINVLRGYKMLFCRRAAPAMPVFFLITLNYLLEVLDSITISGNCGSI